MAGSGRLAVLSGEITESANFPDGPWVVALSGGADSAALAWTASQLGHLEACVHIHHGLEASDRLAGAAGSIAQQLDVPLVVEKVIVQDGASPENMAREARYGALSTSVDPAKTILLGHTRNDVAETVLLNLIRGGGTAGLSGIPYHRPPNYFRPFLDVTRAACRELSALAGMGFLDDPTNEDEAIRRNQVRLSLLPLIEEMNPSAVDALARFASHSRLDAELIDSMVDLDVGILENSLRVPASILSLLHPALRMRTIRNAVSAIRDSGLTSEELVRIEAVVTGEVGATEIEGGVRVERRDALIWFLSETEPSANV